MEDPNRCFKSCSQCVGCVQEDRERLCILLQRGVERKAGTKPRQRRRSEPTMRWRPTERPTTTRWAWILFLLTFSKTKYYMRVFCQFGFRKWKGNVTEKPIEDQSDIIKELYSDLRTVKPHEGRSFWVFFFFLFSSNRCLKKKPSFYLFQGLY